MVRLTVGTEDLPLASERPSQPCSPLSFGLDGYRAFSVGVKGSGCEAGLMSSAGVSDEWSCTSAPRIRFHSVARAFNFSLAVDD